MKKEKILLHDDFNKCLRVPEFLTALGNSTRVSIVCYLTNGDKNVGEIADKVKISQPSVSLHLNKLYASGWVKRRREGRNVYYSIKSDLIVDLLTKIADIFIKQN